MKRRAFLTMLGAAAAAPAVPALGGASGGAAAATYNRYMYGLAVFHARTRATISAKGLAWCLKVSPAQAQAMLAEMTASGVVRPVVGASGTTARAVSNILTPEGSGFGPHARRVRPGRETRRPGPGRKTKSHRPDPRIRATQADLTKLLAHLRRLARDHGFPRTAPHAV